MKTEVRKLTYIPRANEANPGNGLPPGISFCFSELPAFLRKEEAEKQAAVMGDIRMEARVIELERQLEEQGRQHRQALATAREEAANELAAALHVQKEKLMLECVGSVQEAIVAFQKKQAQHFADAEAAVVRLALSIAARILHREAQLDPLMLRGPVHVALEDVQLGTTCVLEVAATAVEAWKAWLAEGGMSARAEVRGKDDVPSTHCRLEIGASSADLSVHSQLAEIERGFFDLLMNRNPGVDREARLDR